MEKTGTVLIFALIAMIVIGVGVGGYFLVKDNGTKSGILKGVNQNMLCYNTLEEMGTILETSCEEDALNEIYILMNRNLMSLPEEEREECAMNVGEPFSLLLVEFCGEDAPERFLDVTIKNIDSKLESATDCLDKQSMGIPCD